MYSESDLAEIVRFHRAKVEVADISDPEDIKTYPNDILLSYLISDGRLSVEDLSHLLKNPEGLRSWLEACSLTGIPPANLPRLDDGVEYEMPLNNLSNSIRIRTGKFSTDYNGGLIVADKSPNRLVYPSGRVVDYFRLTNEQSANISAFDAGYTSEDMEQIFVREVFVTAMLALANAVRHKPEFANLRGHIDQFSHHIDGIVIAHELGEIGYVKSNPSPDTSDENAVKAYLRNRELMAEIRARQLLYAEGEDLRFYNLYHTLRKVTDTRGRNISQLVLDRDSLGKAS